MPKKSIESEGISFDQLVEGSGLRPNRVPASGAERFDFFCLSFSDLHVFSQIREMPGILIKKMFGGLAVYKRQKLILLLMESPGERQYKKIISPYDIWDGVLIPTDRKHHASLQKEFPFLISHAVLGKWLYLPRAKKSYESLRKKIAPYFGVDSRLGVPGKPGRRSGKKAPQVRTKRRPK